MRLIATVAAAVMVASTLACASSPVVVERRLDDGSDVIVRIELQPDHRGMLNRYIDGVAATLRTFRAWSAPYPDPSVTIVDAPWRGAPAAAGGAVVLDHVRWWTTPTAMAPELATARAVSRMALTKVMDVTALPPWFVDGLNEFAARRIVLGLFAANNNSPGYAMYEARVFGGFVPRFQWIRLLPESDGEPIDAYRVRPRPELPAASRADETRLAATATLGLYALERWVGAPVFDAIMSHFFREARAARPTVADFARTASATSGQDLSWLFAAVLGSSTVFDYAVADISTRGPAGTGGSDGADAEYETAVTVARAGDAMFTGATAPRVGPFESGGGVTVLVTFADGARATEGWDGRDERKTYRYVSRAPAVSAVVDPDRVITPDLWRTNNGRTLEPRPVAARRWAARWLVWLENCLVTYSLLV